MSCSLGGGLTATVSFRGTRIPLHRFGGASPAAPKQDTGRTVPAMINGRWVRVHPGAAASGHQLRSTAPTRFEHAFVARMRSGHVGIFERTGGVTADGGDEIRQLMGSSVPQMIGSEEVSGKLSEAAMRKFDERLEHEISRIINGW